MNKNAASLVFCILNILGDVAREPKNKELKKKKYYWCVSTRYRKWIPAYLFPGVASH
jgi:hypothetical protein